MEKSFPPSSVPRSMRVSSFLSTPKMRTTPAAEGSPSHPTVIGLIAPSTTPSTPSIDATCITKLPAIMMGKASKTKPLSLNQVRCAVVLGDGTL